MRIAFSPCPNDTFVFHAWVHGLIPGAPKLDVTYADIDITNGLAAAPNGPDVLKISYAALPWVLSEYALLPCGGALGRGWTAGADQDRQQRSGGFDWSSGGGPQRTLNRLPPVPPVAARNVPGGVGDIVVMPFTKSCRRSATARSTPDWSSTRRASRTPRTDLPCWPTWEAGGKKTPACRFRWGDHRPPFARSEGHRRLDPRVVEYAWPHPEASREYVRTTRKR